MNEICKKIKEAGFPQITRWEVENNYRRHMSVTGEETMPPLGAILSEIKGLLYLQKMHQNYWIASLDAYESEIKEEFVQFREKPFNSYIDTQTKLNCDGKSAEEASARLWLALNAPPATGGTE
jgi:hypothetical protein